jgi:competence ComEA-like helix-hairpin-helix protein
MQQFNHKIQLFVCGIMLLIVCTGFAHADDSMTNGAANGSDTTLTAQANNGQQPISAQGPVWDLNTANALELSSIKGIGFKKAQAIVTYRETYGNFTNIEQVTLVKGIGKKMLARMQSSITVTSEHQHNTTTSSKQVLNPGQDE